MAGDHAHPRLVAVWSGGPDADGRRGFCSGLLIAPRLVLTCRHGVVHDAGVPQSGAVIQMVTGPRGAVGLGDPVAARVAWAGAADLDASLLELPEGLEVPNGFLAGGLEWGELIGTRPVTVTASGMPSFAGRSTGHATEVETARGTVTPGTYASSDRYAVDLATGWPQGWKDWAGMSGAAVLCEASGCLVGVMAWSDTALEGRRLAAVPVRALLGEIGFREVIGRHLGRVPDTEPAELAPFLARPRAAGSLGGLLRADAALVGFTGRTAEIRALERWRDQPSSDGPDVRALLVTARGGEGKTRLAVEFLARSKREGWTGGLLRPGLSAAHAGMTEVVAHPARRLLLVIDYAAARAAEIAALVQAVVQARPRVPVRLLMLARAGGQWWSDLAMELDEELPGLEDEVMPLSPLLAAGGTAEFRRPDPGAVFSLAARSLAAHLTGFTNRTDAELRDIAESLPVPDLSARSFEHVLTVQMTALVALLQECDPVEASDSGPEAMLLRHEQKYRDGVARHRGLDDLRSIRDRAVVSAALVGARGASLSDARQAACEIAEAALSPDLRDRTARQRDVAAWIAEIYPPDQRIRDQDAEYWGEVLPDRLGEFLIIDLLGKEHAERGGGLLESVANRTDGPGAGRALLTLSRAAEHDTRAASWIEQLVLANPELFGPTALVVAVYAENPLPLRKALVRLGLIDSELLRLIVGAAHDSLPRYSLTELDTNAGMTREIVGIYRELAGLDRATYMSDFAFLLESHSTRLADSGGNAEAFSASQEAVGLYRELVDHDRAAHVSGLSRALVNFANRLREAGRRAEASEISKEALALRRELAELDRAGVLPGLASSLSNHAAKLTETGRWDEAAAVSEEAIGLRRELASLDRRAHLPGLALSLSNHSVILAETGRRSEAVVVSEEAVAAYRESVEFERDESLQGLAGALDNHANRLMENGRQLEALEFCEEALSLRRELVEINYDAFLPDLAGSLNNHSVLLASAGREADAISASREAVSTYRELAALNRDTYLPHLATALNTHGLRLSDARRYAEAVTVTEESLALRRELAVLNRDAYLKDLATSLGNYASQLGDMGLRDEAIPVSVEAVDSLRELSIRNRDAHLPMLAIALSNHAGLLAVTGRREEALEFSAEALAFRRELCTLNRQAYLEDLANSLTNHSNRLAEMRRTADAVSPAEESVGFYRELVARNRDGYLRNLAIVLGNYALRLSSAQRHVEAASAAGESVLFNRELVARNRAAHLANMASALMYYASCLGKLGRLDEAIQAAEESVNLYQELITHNRAAYLPNYLESLTVIGRIQMESDQYEESFAHLIAALELAAELPDYLIGRAQLAANTLREAYATNPYRAERMFRRLTGEPLPDSLKRNKSGT